jgi:hypothetical protein
MAEALYVHTRHLAPALLVKTYPLRMIKISTGERFSRSPFSLDLNQRNTILCLFMKQPGI